MTAPHALPLDSIQALIDEATPHFWRGLVFICDSALPSNPLAWPQPALVFSDSPGAHSKPLSQYRHYLGTNTQLLVLDFRRQQHADALAALAGTLQGGGCLVLLVPNNWQRNAFLQRLVRLAPKQFSRWVQQPGLTTQESLSLPAAVTFKQLNTEQRAALRILQQNPQPAITLISAPRGRGKSTLLGAYAHQLQTQGRAVMLCAPSKQQAAQVFLQAPNISFVAPDQILQRAYTKDTILLLDEAASLPRQRLDAIIERFPNLVMATTTEGYEGCGKGFVIQLCSELRRHYQNFTEIQLNQPQRWAEDCPLERWLNQCLLLSPTSPVQPPQSSASPLTYQHVHASQLSDALLSQCFALLLRAHYQSSPNDLKMLLTDPQQTLILQWQQNHLSGLVWLSAEGEFDAALAADSVAGKRRPSGHLLAQLLARHMQNPALAQLSMLRIVRIAVQPELHRQGLGSALLTEVKSFAHHHGYAVLGSSFAAAPQVVRFWMQNGLRLVRLGSKPGSVSGWPAALMLWPALRLDAEVSRWADFFAHEWPAYQAFGAPPLPVQAHPLNDVQINAYQTLAAQRVVAFARGELDFDSCKVSLRTAFAEWCRAEPALNLAIHKCMPTAQAARHCAINGRKDFIKMLRQICLARFVKI